MRHTYHEHAGVRKTIHRDAHDPGRIYLETVTNDARGLAMNERIRKAALLQQGDENPLVDGAEMTAAFSFPTITDYNLAKRKHPDLFAKLEEGGSAAIHAGESLSVLMPEYCVMVRRGDAKR